MRRLAPALVAGLLLLTGCAATPLVDTDPTVSAPVEPTGDGCIELSQAAIDSLQDGLDNKGAGYTIENTAAIKDGDSWWVAADLNGDPDVTAVWMTIHDPTADAENAYLSATELASLVSDYAMPEDLTGADPVNAAEDCLP